MIVGENPFQAEKIRPIHLCQTQKAHLFVSLKHQDDALQAAARYIAAGFFPFKGLQLFWKHGPDDDCRP